MSSKIDDRELESLRNIKIANMLGCKSDRRFMRKCPFHSDNTASFVLYPDNSFHCFGCKAHGIGAIDFCMAMGYSFQESVDELRKHL